MPRRRRVDRRRAEDPLVLMAELVAANVIGCRAFPPGRTVDEVYGTFANLPWPSRTDGFGWLAFQAGELRPCDALLEHDPFDDEVRPAGLRCGEGSLEGRCLFGHANVIDGTARFAAAGTAS